MQAEPIRGERWQAPPDEVVLLAVDRAERHKQVRRDDPGVSVGAIAEHLGMSRGAVASRRLNPVLRRLEARGPLSRYRFSGDSSPWWTLNEAGRRICDDARDRAAELPESPQHLAWRQARARAMDRLPVFATEFAAALQQVAADVAGGRSLPSIEWLELGEALRELARRVGFATYCAEEWAEPTDDTPDIDDPPMVARGRRNVRLWDAREAGDA